MSVPSPRQTPDADAPFGASTEGLHSTPQRVVKVRRDYNSWVAKETMEDYALRFTPRSFRKWSALRVANTAFGAASFLVLEAVGATLLVEYGFINAFWAILATGLVIFLAGLPISVYAARHGLDMDLLTRGAGFGYIGSTITSLIYASFTFVFFALEAAIMAYALELAFDIPPAWGYLLCALIVIPLVTHGVTAISQLQVWTQPLWLVLLVLPYVYVFKENPGVLNQLASYAGQDGNGKVFSLQLFGAAMTVGIALITQMGEQADYLRFMPEVVKPPAAGIPAATPRGGASTASERPRAGRRFGRLTWWVAVVIGGPGWVVLGVVKMLGGALLAYLAISHFVPEDRAVDPNQMYLAAYEYVFPGYYGWAVAATALLVVISQLKINVTNAYAGSLAWSNFFARLTHSHPGRVVWVVFNTVIALMLMELNVFQALSSVLGLYSNIAIAWMMAVVADLVINKPLGLSPKGIEFKRAHLYDVNPVGVGAMGAASLLSIVAYLGLLGPMAQAFSALIALVTAFVTAPLIAWFTKGRYYIARSPESSGAYLASTVQRRCVICEREYEGDDMAHCPAYRGPICSLCCSLDARCEDLCKPDDARAAKQMSAVLRTLLPKLVWPYLETGLGHYLLLMAAIAPLLAGACSLVFRHELGLLGAATPEQIAALRFAFVKAYAGLLLISGIVAWWLVLTHKSRQVAQEESNRQTQLLVREIDLHRLTDDALQQAKLAAEAANQAKTRYISTISHELRTPLNSILGYAQLLDEDQSMPPHRKQAVSVILRGGDHLLSLIEGTLDIARIEGGKLRLDSRPLRFPESVQQIVRMFELQAAAKGISFRAVVSPNLPAIVRADEKRLRQILINVIGNAVKFTSAGQIEFRASHAREMALFEIEDSGPGIAPEEIDRVFEPFARGSGAAGAVGGTGLGLTISKMLTDLMGGEMTVTSQPGVGSLFRVRLFLPEVRATLAERELPKVNRAGYIGPRRRVLVVDNEEVDRSLLASRLEPLGFEVAQAASGHACLALLHEWRDEGIEADAILMDLAMPGIDGWETVRRIRAGQLSAAPVAIVSANAFDQSLDNDVGITARDFITKPLRLGELLDWLGRRLQLEWVDAVPEAPAAITADEPAELLHYPSDARLQALDEMIALGYFRGIVKLLDEIEAEDPKHAAFVAVMRKLAREFQLESMTAIVRQARVS